MPFDLTILTKKIEGLKEAYEKGNFADALASAVNTGSGLMQQRIFTQNKDVDGQSFGQYVGKKKKLSDSNLSSTYLQLRLLSATKTERKRIKDASQLELTSYQRKRAERGRQVNKKDLEFEGSLRRAIETQIADEKAAILNFNNDLAAKIAKGQEAQITNIRNGRSGTTKGEGIKIFALNASEKEQVVEQGAELIKEILKPK
jgi:hypothetical protein